MRGGPGIAVVIALVAAAACSSPSSPGMLAGPIDAGDAGGGSPDDASEDALADARRPAVDAALLIDAPIGPDAPPEVTDLAVICGGHEPHSFDEWEDCYQQRKCEWEVGCVPQNSYRDVQDCITSGNGVSGGQLAAERAERQRAVADGTAAIDPVAFKACLIGTSATHCPTALFDANCLTRFTGTVHDGGSCATDVDCASPGATCQATCTDACCAGTCQPKPTVGEPCWDYESCAPGLVCSVHGPQGEDRRCLSGDFGSACSDVLDCDLDAWCDPQAGRCKPTFPIGAQCTGSLQCSGDASCIGTSISNTKPGLCLRTSEPGDPCDSLCYGNLSCDGGHCRSLPVRGQSCSALTPCAGADTVCNSGFCVARSSEGMPCTGDTCLPGLFCTSALGDPIPGATCAAPRAAGGACNDPAQCDSYFCTGAGTQMGTCLSCP